MAETTIAINYTVIDQCVLNMQRIIEDPYVSIELAKLQNSFEYSQSDYTDILKQSITVLGEIHQEVINLILASKKMLITAKQLYKETDENMALN